MDNTQRITLDIRDNQTYEQIYTKQYNKGFPIEFEITKDGEPFDLSGCAALFEMKKPDKTVIWSSCNITDNIVSIEVTEQMTIVDGRADFQVTLTKGDVLITTVTGTIKIDRSTIQDDDIESSDDFSLITDILVQINDAKQAAIDAQVSAESAEISATNAKTSETNAKASETSAATSATNASASASAAKTSEINAKTSETNSKTSETNAQNSEIIATEQATLSKSYAVGSTSTRIGEDIDNSKYYYESIKSIADETSSVLAKKADLDVNGQVRLDQIPKVALDNLVIVENDTARFALTVDDIQTGDTVKVLQSSDGSGEKMYLVIDDTKLNSEEGYTGYSASITWETIGGKPNNIAFISEDSEVINIDTPIELTRNDIANNLTTDDSTKVLSATQGKVLNNTLNNILGDLASEYDNTSTYAVGDYVIYDELLYKCTTDITTAEEFNSAKWEQTDCGNEIKTLNSNLENALGGYKLSIITTKFADDTGYNYITSQDFLGYNTSDFEIISATYRNDNGSWYSMPIGIIDSNGIGVIKISGIIRIYASKAEYFGDAVKLMILHKPN